jgi:hypothetical protein
MEYNVTITGLSKRLEVFYHNEQPIYGTGQESGNKPHMYRPTMVSSILLQISNVEANVACYAVWYK